MVRVAAEKVDHLQSGNRLKMIESAGKLGNGRRLPCSSLFPHCPAIGSPVTSALPFKWIQAREAGRHI